MVQIKILLRKVNRAWNGCGPPTKHKVKEPATGEHYEQHTTTEKNAPSEEDVPLEEKEEQSPDDSDPEAPTVDEMQNKIDEVLEEEDDLGTKICTGVLLFELVLFGFRLLCCMLSATRWAWFSTRYHCFHNNLPLLNNITMETNSTLFQTTFLTNTTFTLTPYVPPPSSSPNTTADQTSLLPASSGTNLVRLEDVVTSRDFAFTYVYVLADCYHTGYVLQNFIWFWTYTSVFLRLVPVVLMCWALELMYTQLRATGSWFVKATMLVLSSVVWAVYAASVVWEVWISTQVERKVAANLLFMVVFMLVLWVGQGFRNRFCPKTTDAEKRGRCAAQNENY